MGLETEGEGKGRGRPAQRPHRHSGHRQHHHRKQADRAAQSCIQTKGVKICLKVGCIAGLVRNQVEPQIKCINVTCSSPLLSIPLNRSTLRRCQFWSISRGRFLFSSTFSGRREGRAGEIVKFDRIQFQFRDRV